MGKPISVGLGVAMIMAVAPGATARAGVSFSDLTANQQIADFKVECLYVDEAGTAMGGRFRHVPSDFVLDLLRIQSVPQAFMYVNSTPPSDQGEPHTCEHLLLGKGPRGRAVASLEDMSLGTSSAFTMQLETCYDYHTAAGADVFFNLMEKKLDALLHPNFSDEEIRREVCNMGIKMDPTDSSLSLEEKGTVYNEMVSTYERPFSPLFRQLGILEYGARHPLALESGGLPDSIRTMVPADMRRFHGGAYHLNNMGMIVAIPDQIEIDDCLKRTSAIFARVEPDAKTGLDPALNRDRLPAPQSAPVGTIKIVGFPNQNPNEPGPLIFGWLPTRTMDNNEAYLLDLLVANLSGGETSDLYRLFIDSQTRTKDVGATSVFGWAATDLGRPVYIGLDNVRRDALNEAQIDSVRSIIRREIATIAGWADGSPELTTFNERAQSRLTERRRDLRKFLNTPPGFGYRGIGAEWMEHLKRMQKSAGFRKPLTLDDELKNAQTLLSSGKNFWRDYIQKWQLVDQVPFAVAAVPDPDLSKRTEEARKKRIDDYVANLQQKYALTDRAAAIRRFRADYDAQTAVIDSAAATLTLPPFISNPPMTLDDQLKFAKDTLPGSKPLVKSTFDNMTGASVGLAFGINVVPESLLFYTAALPTLLTEVGVIKDGKPVPYDQMKEQIRREILELSAYYSVNYRSERVELVVRGAGSDRDESNRAVDWMTAVLYGPDWRSENLSRLRDAIDLALSDARNTMKNAEEAWVMDPANAYWKQTNPVILNTDCFLTRAHDLQRLRWLLKDAGSPAAQSEFAGFLTRVAAFGRAAGRDQLNLLTAALAGETGKDSTLLPDGAALVGSITALSSTARSLVVDGAKDLRQCLPDVPDATLASDWQYLCRQMTDDLAVPPAKVLADLHGLMGLILHADNVRGFMVGSTPNQQALQPAVDHLVARLDKKVSSAQIYARTPRIIERLRDHTPDLQRPLYVGLINGNTGSGVFINTAPCASFVHHDKDGLLNFLAARLYGGHGAHSMFMKTWGAGLAYSNGLRSNESNGRIIYYAERCPDLAQTMQFVVDQLKKAPYDTSLAQYAIAQAFMNYRSGSSYEDRAEAMAADLADGVTPDSVRQFRQGILALRDSRDLYANLQGRMEYVYGQVLPGYGPPAADVQDGVNFIIGPEKQFQSYGNYLHSAEGNVILYRLYPRDYWNVESRAN
ncbi:MAG: hypothetical protein HY304_04840 [candidate division Zixibacteria bacterium]|nr:hypothetical protein [candidate division Zixibacteria bacterium]